MMTDTSHKITSIDVDQLFESGSIVVFKCAPTDVFPVTFVSSNVESILGFPVEYFIENENGWSDRIHPEDVEKTTQEFKKVLEEGGVAYNEYRFRRKDGEEIWLRDEIKMQFDEDRNPTAILGTSFEITERKKAELKTQQEKEFELRNRLAYQHALSECSNLLIKGEDNSVFDQVVKILQNVTQTDRAYFFANSTDNKGRLLVSQLFEVCKEGVEPQIDNPELQNIPYTELPYFFQTLSKGKIINRACSKLPSPEKELLMGQEIKSVLMLPIFLRDEWFGFIGFDSTEEHRVWEAHEVLTLQTIVEFIGTFLKRRSINEKLVHQKKFTEHILDNLPSIIAVIDKKMQLQIWNRTAEKLTGYTSDELKRMSIFDVAPKEDHNVLFEVIKRIRHNDNSGQEVKIKHKEGAVRPFFWRGARIELNGEEMFLVIGMDISKQKEMEYELLQEKRFTDAIIDGLPGTFFILNEQLDFVRVNTNLVDDLGYSADELLQMNAFETYVAADHDYLAAKVEELFEEGRVNMESVPVNKNGEKLFRNLNAVLFERNGKRFIIGTGQDISDLKHREDQLRATLKEKEVLLQEIHHRVKNNLAVISGLLELQVYEYSDPSFQRLIKESQMRIQTMAMIHEKLYQSQNLSRIHVVGYIHELIEQIQDSISYGSTSVTIHTDIDEVWLSINQAIPFALAINEIISNALEHAFVDQDEGTINIKLTEKDGIIHSSITDNGCGFSSKEELEVKSSLGFTLITALMTQIDAEWEVEGTDGVCYNMKFSKDRDQGSSSGLRE